jgi:hypothetical protein
VGAPQSGGALNLGEANQSFGSHGSRPVVKVDGTLKDTVFKRKPLWVSGFYGCLKYFLEKNIKNRHLKVVALPVNVCV